jgi:hypothetical protein
MTRVPFIPGKPRRWFIGDALFRHDHERGIDYQLTFPVAFWAYWEILNSRRFVPLPIHWIYAPAIVDFASERTLFAWCGTGWAFRLWWRWRK